MSIQIYNSDGLELPMFTQWDVNQIISIAGLNITVDDVPNMRVHYANRTTARAAVVAPTWDAVNSRLVADVPNILLQQAEQLAVFVYKWDDIAHMDKPARTIAVVRVAVLARPKPEDYDYKENVHYIDWVQKAHEVEVMLDRWDNEMSLLRRHAVPEVRGRYWALWDERAEAYVPTEFPASIQWHAGTVVNDTGSFAVDACIGDYYLNTTSGNVYECTQLYSADELTGWEYRGNIRGAEGVGIASIAKTSTSGLQDTYTITFTNGVTTTFTVSNGADGTDAYVTAENIASALGYTPADQGGVDSIGERVSATEGKIPVAATSSNQLADKNFVNSSIATNTAHFIGTFSSIEALRAYDGTVTNNDYAFVTSTDEVGNSQFDRYKYTSALPAWTYEYTLNNSSFTADQWAAINSAITGSLVTAYNAHVADSTIHVTSNDKAAWGAKYDKPNGGIPKTDLADAVQTSLGKADTALQSAPVTSVNSKTGDVSLDYSDVGADASGAAAAVQGNLDSVSGRVNTIESKIPNAAASGNQLADKNFVNSSVATNTANFIGTFTSMADLQAYSGTVTNNDYAFITSTDAAGNTLYDRYKYAASLPAWIYEYTLNNSSFTSDQWAAINSGITSGDVTKLSGIDTGAQVNVLEGVSVNGAALTPTNKSVDITVPDELSDLTDDSTHRLVTDAEKTAWNAKADKPVVGTITLAAASWSGAASPYTYDITSALSGIALSANTKISLALNAANVAQLTSDRITYFGAQAETSGGSTTVTIVSVGAKPSAAMTVQYIVTETEAAS